jgi:hypothetical protein
LKWVLQLKRLKECTTFKKQDMTKEEKQLMLEDLCARIPYGVKATTKSGCWNETYVVEGYRNDRIYLDCPVYDEGDDEWMVESVVPYLRPMSSMTEEEKYQARYMNEWECTEWEVCDYLNSRYLDYRGLIEKGLAIEAPKNMYNI